MDQIRVKCPAKKCTWEVGQFIKLRDSTKISYSITITNAPRGNEHVRRGTRSSIFSTMAHRYFSKKAEFMRKLNDDEEIKDEKPNMLHPSMKATLREKLEKEWEVQMKYKDEEFLRQTKRLRKTFGL